MKKLLAMILCVMMFVALIPTAAFAGGLPVDDPLLTVKQYQKHIENMIKNTKTNVENSYKALVGDQVVYSSAKAMDDAVVELVNAIADPVIAKGDATKAWADLCKDAIRAYLDEAVAEKIEDNYYKALDSDGDRDSLKYAQLIANSINDVLTDKQFIAGYQAVATNFALRALVSDMRDSIKDQYDDFRNGIDASFQTKFAAKYTTLVDEYIDTLATGTLKAASNSVLWLDLQDVIGDAQDDYDAAVATSTDLYKATVKTAKATYTDAVKDEKEDVAEAEVNVEIAEKKLAKAVAIGDVDLIDQYESELADARSALKDAQKAYKAAAKEAQKEYDATVEQAEKDRIGAEFDAYSAYAETVIPAQIEYDLSVETINPWAEYVLPTVGSWN